MDLRDLLKILHARWVAIAAITIIGGLAGLGLSLLATPLYSAKTTYYVTSLGGDSASAAYQGSLASQQRVQSYAQLVRSEDLAERVLDDVELDMSARELATRVEASADSKTVLLSVTVTDREPSRATALAEAYGRVLPELIEDLETPDGGGEALAKLTVVNPPSLPEAPVFPRTEQNIVIGTGLGLLFGLAVALLSSALDRRVKSTEQIEAIADAPIVGSIPFKNARDMNKESEHLVDFREGHSPVAESYRRLRTNLRFLKVDNPPRVFVITSSVADEGKSETAVNLSLALAEAGSRALLIEADLRRPRVVDYLSMADTIGLTSILSGQADFGDVVQPTKYEGVDLLACGPLPPNPSELLASETALSLLQDLRGKYDYVVIDSPPLLPVTDGALLARMTDGAFLVVRSNRTTTDQVGQAVANLSKANANLLGVITIANKPVKKSSAGYYDPYYYSTKSTSDSTAK